MWETTFKALAMVEKARRAVRWGIWKRAPSRVRGKVDEGVVWLLCGMRETGCARRSGEEDGEGVEGRGLGRFDSSRIVLVYVDVKDEETTYQSSGRH
jgi:hypothetical protein